MVIYYRSKETKEDFMKKIVCVTFMILVFVFSGCNNDKKVSDVESSGSKENDVTKEINMPSSFQKDVDGINFDTNIYIPEGISLSNLKKGSADLQKINIEKAKDEFVGNKEIERENIYDIVSPVYKEKLYMYGYKDGTDFSVSQYTLNFMKTNTISHINFNTDMNKDKFQKNMEMSFSSREDASKAVVQSISNFGIKLDNQYQLTTFTLDHDTLKSEEYHADHDGNIREDLYKNDWSEKDDMYFISMRQTTQGVPVYFIYFDEEMANYEESEPINAYYSQDGIASLNVRNVYSFKEGDESFELLSFDDIAKSVAESYGQIVGDETYAMKDAILYMMPIFNKKKQVYHTELVWLFDVELTMAETVTNGETTPSKTYDMNLIVNASTGDIIVSGYE